MAKQTKTQQVIEAIKQQVQFGWTIQQHVKYGIAMDVDCSISTVNRAIAQMRDAGLIDESGVFTGRANITPSELAAAMPEETILTDNKYNELARQFCAEVLTVRRSVYNAVRMGYLQELNGGSYGYMVRAA